MVIKMFDVLSVGVLVADALAKPVSKMPEKGKLELVESILLFSGGCAANAAIALAKIGRKSAICGKIGNDGFGQFMLSELAGQHVNTKGLRIDERHATSASLVLSDPSGERSFLHCLGANAHFCKSDIDLSLVKESGIIFVAGSLLMPSFDGEGCAEFLKTCKGMGKITALDTAWDSTNKWMDSLKSSMRCIDYFLPSYHEAVPLSGGKTDLNEISDVFLEMGVQVVIIKNGERGCFIKTANGETFTIPAFSDVLAVDTNGAGDSFCAGFLAGLSKGWPLCDCGKFANAAGAFCVMQPGASTGIKSEAEILDFIHTYESQR